MITDINFKIERLLSLERDWNDDGVEQVSFHACECLIRVLEDNVELLSKFDVSPCHDGSIDLYMCHDENSSFGFLMNFGQRDVSFFAENGKIHLSGTFDVENTDAASYIIDMLT